VGRKKNVATKAGIDQATTLSKRARAAVAEGRFQQAHDLAKTLFHHLPTPGHRELLVQAAFGRADQLLAAHHDRDAAALLEAAAVHFETPDERSRLALTLARAGASALARRVAGDLNDPALLVRIQGHIADAALTGKVPAGESLPAEFTPHLDLVRQAFAALAQGRDEDARTALGGIGLTSPLLEWKVLLRGLLAYYARDDARAVENWRRLQTDRQPARVAAPYLLALDRGFRDAQPPEARKQLQAQLDQLQGNPLAARLRTAQRLLADERQMAAAFRQLAEVVPLLQAEAPALVKRLAAIAFWAIVDHGYPEDVARYLRAFGPPPEDPTLRRLEALALEHRGDMQAAHQAWKDFEAEVAKHAAALPVGHAERIRALVWQHMGENAAAVPEERQSRGFGFDPAPRPLQPSAEECYRKSLELAPDRLAAHLALVHYHLGRGKAAKALQAGKRLLQQFPEHAEALEVVGDLSIHKQDYSQALGFLQRALTANPLNGRLRIKLALAHAGNGARLAEAGDFAAARAAFAAGVALREPGHRAPLLCQSAACEFLAGAADDAERFLQQARAEQGHDVAIAFSMLVNAIRLKLGKALKSRFDSEFNTLLQAPPSPAAGAALAAHTAALKIGGVKYTGQKTHEKKVVAYLERLRAAKFSELQLQQLCVALQDLGANKVLKSYFQVGQERFPSNPQFFLAQIDFLLEQSPTRFRPWEVEQLMKKVQALAAQAPPDQRQALLQAVADREQELRERSPFFGLMGSHLVHDPFDDGPDYEFADDDDDSDYWDDGFVP
jgi:tetratricopeptide (TPR) repeat protein